jgi:hypothetical protein
MQTVLERFRATVASIKQDSWVVEEPEDTQSLSAAASGFSGSADFEEVIPSSSELHGYNPSGWDPYPGSTHNPHGFLLPLRPLVRSKQEPDGDLE